MSSHKSSLPRHLLLAALLAAGFGTLWAVLVGWLGIVIQEARTGKTRPPRETIVVTTDGTPVIQSVSFDDLSRTTYRDVNGREHAPITQNDQAIAMYLYGERSGPHRLLSHADWRTRIKIFMDEREPAAVWYFVHDGNPQGSGYFVGYEHTSNRLIGYIGRSGFRAERPPPGERISVRGNLALNYEYWSSATLTIYNANARGARPDRWDVPPRLVHVPSGNSLRLVDLDARTVTTAFEAPAPIVSVSVPTLSSYAGSKSTKEQPILVWSGDKIYKLNHQYRVIGTFTVPADVNRSTTVTWYETESGQSVVEYVRTPKAGPGRVGDVTPPTVSMIAADGAIRQSFEVTLRSGADRINEEATSRLLGFALPAPAILAGAVLTMAMENPAFGPATARGGLLKQALPALATVLVISSILAAVVWRQGRVFGFSQREQIAWAVFVLLFGVPAFAGFLLHRRWPAREPCPHCHVRSARDRDACTECGTPFPEPTLKGTEIFA
ncbi:MAG: hypothetical protein P4L84_06595 [Isosphaeraceae bacterium]|nr:hypothetical protein [Isosphaeraceae bacterium]